MDNVTAISSAPALTGAERRRTAGPIRKELDLDAMPHGDVTAIRRALDVLRIAAWEAENEFSCAWRLAAGPTRDACLADVRRHCKVIVGQLRELSRLGVKP